MNGLNFKQIKRMLLGISLQIMAIWFFFLGAAYLSIVGTVAGILSGIAGVVRVFLGFLGDDGGRRW